jgi:hypothetical protein
MSAALSFTEADIFVVLQALLVQMLPTGIEVVRSQVNRTPEPHGADFITMTPLFRVRLETNTDTYFDGFFTSVPGVKSALAPIRFDVQIDVHGPASGDNAQIISTLWRDEFATSYFDASTIDAQALYASDPRQMAFINAESQFEDRWAVDLSMQVNQVVQLDQQFADHLVTGLIDVDVVYPP